jgi:hypothetical protein
VEHPEPVRTVKAEHAAMTTAQEDSMESPVSENRLQRLPPTSCSMTSRQRPSASTKS